MMPKALTMEYRGPREVAVIETDVRDPGPGEAQVRRAVCGICSWDQSTYLRGREYAHAAPPGHEGFGQVIKVGAGVTSVREGDWIIGGGFQSLETVKADELRPVRSDVNDLFDWLAEPVCCVVNGIERLGLFPGDRIAIIGGGYMGLLTLQGLRHTLAGALIVIEPDADRRALAVKYGADEVIDPGDQQGRARLEQLQRERVDRVVETAGVQASLDLAARIVAAGGRISLFAWHKDPRTIDTTAWHLGGFEVVNSSPMSAPDYGKIIVRVPTLIQRGLFCQRDLVTHVGTLEQLPDLLNASVDRTGGYLKGVVVYPGFEDGRVASS